MAFPSVLDRQIPQRAYASGRACGACAHGPFSAPDAGFYSVEHNIAPRCGCLWNRLWTSS